jgi:predicted component of type VI protein secretion system
MSDLENGALGFDKNCFTAELEEEVRRNVKHIFNTDLFEKAVTLQQIESAVYRSEYSLMSDLENGALGFDKNCLTLNL